MKHILESIQITGGASYNPITGILNPQSGYMLSLPGYEKIYNTDVKNVLELKSVFNDFLTEDIWDLAADPDNYIGFWIHDNKLYVDVSQNIDDLNYALYEGRKRKQICIWDCERQTEIGI